MTKENIMRKITVLTKLNLSSTRTFARTPHSHTLTHTFALVYSIHYIRGEDGSKVIFR